jgi:hypothetical protein
MGGKCSDNLVRGFGRLFYYKQPIVSNIRLSNLIKLYGVSPRKLEVGESQQNAIGAVSQAFSISKQINTFHSVYSSL